MLKTHRSYYKYMKNALSLDVSREVLEADYQLLGQIVLPATLRQVHTLKQTSIMKRLRQNIASRFERFLAHPVQYVALRATSRRSRRRGEGSFSGM